MWIHVHFCVFQSTPFEGITASVMFAWGTGKPEASSLCLSGPVWKLRLWKHCARQWVFQFWIQPGFWSRRTSWPRGFKERCELQLGL